MRTYLARMLILASLMVGSLAAPLTAAEKVRGVYTSILSFATEDARQAAINAEPSFLMDKHKKSMGGGNELHVSVARRAGFNTIFMTIYPLWGKDWWAIPEARNLVKDAVIQAQRNGFDVHLGLSLFNAHMCQDPSRFPGASRTIQCDGTRPSWICFFDDRLWEYFIRNTVELAKVGRDVPGAVFGIFVDPESYGPECYLCFCHNCIEKFNTEAGQEMPTDLVKPDGWLHARGLWEKYTKEWHDQEVKRHAVEMRTAIHAVNSEMQLSSLLWDYPVAVRIGDPRQQYFRMLAIGLGTIEKPSWTLPEHSYYSDAADLNRIISQIYADIEQAGAKGQVQVLPGIRILRRPASSLLERGRVIRDANVPGYWFYELSDLCGKGAIDFEGALTEPEDNYISAFGETNRATTDAP